MTDVTNDALHKLLAAYYGADGTWSDLDRSAMRQVVKAMRALEPDPVRSDEARVGAVHCWLRSICWDDKDADKGARELLAAIDAVDPKRAPLPEPDGDAIEAALDAWVPGYEWKASQQKVKDSLLASMRDANAAYLAHQSVSVVEWRRPGMFAIRPTEHGRIYINVLLKDGSRHHWPSWRDLPDGVVAWYDEPPAPPWATQAPEPPETIDLGGLPYEQTIAEAAHPMPHEAIQTALGAASSDPPMHAVVAALARAIGRLTGDPYSFPVFGDEALLRRAGAWTALALRRAAGVAASEREIG